MKTPNILVALVFGVILIVGAMLRIYKIESIPNGLYVDEAAIGFNAYSLNETGTDEYGKSWPVFLRSYNAYASPAYMYITRIPVHLFGLSIYSTRILSVISGMVSIILVYQILKDIDLIKSRFSILFGTIIFTISPWAIFYSRGAFEANLAFTFLCLSVYFVLQSKKNPNYYILSIFVLSISTYVYQAQRLISLILAVYFTIWAFQPKNIKGLFNKYSVLGGVIFTVIQLPQLLIVSSPAFSNRAGGLFYQEELLSQAGKIPLPFLISYLLAFTRDFGAKFVSYVSPRNLFQLPDPDLQRSIPELSVFYSWLVIPFGIGIFHMLKKLTKKNVQLVVVLIVTSIVAPALTKDPFSSLRSLGLLLPLIIVITIGIDKMLSFKPRITKICFYFLIGVSLMQLWRSYFVLMPSMRARAWDYGYEKLANEIASRPDKLFVVDQSRKNPIYIELAFFMHIDPQLIQENTSEYVRENYYGAEEFKNYYKFLNVETRNIVWEKDIYQEMIIVGDSLAVSKDQASEHELSEVFKITDPLGNIVFIGYQTNPYSKCMKTNFDNSACTVYLKRNINL